MLFILFFMLNTNEVPLLALSRNTIPVHFIQRSQRSEIPICFKGASTSQSHIKLCRLQMIKSLSGGQADGSQSIHMKELRVPQQAQLTEYAILVNDSLAIDETVLRWYISYFIDGSAVMEVVYTKRRSC